MVYWFCKLDKKLDGNCVISRLAFIVWLLLCVEAQKTVIQDC